MRGRTVRDLHRSRTPGRTALLGVPTVLLALLAPLWTATPVFAAEPVTVTAEPVAYGSTLGGSTFVLHGTALDRVDDVRVGAAAAVSAVAAPDGTALTVIAPAAVRGTRATSVTLSTPDGTLVLGTAFRYADPPGRPLGLRAIAGDGEVETRWRAPGVDGGSPVTGYVLQLLAPGGVWTEVTRSTVTTAWTHGLTNGLPVSFRVAAVAGGGVGDWSAVSSSTPFPFLPSARSTGPRPLTALEAGDVVEVVATGLPPGLLGSLRRDPTAPVLATAPVDGSGALLLRTVVPADAPPGSFPLLVILDGNCTCMRRTATVAATVVAPPPAAPASTVAPPTTTAVPDPATPSVPAAVPATASGSPEVTSRTTASPGATIRTELARTGAPSAVPAAAGGAVALGLGGLLLRRRPGRARRATA